METLKTKMLKALQNKCCLCNAEENEKAKVNDAMRQLIHEVFNIEVSYENTSY